MATTPYNFHHELQQWGPEAIAKKSADSIVPTVAEAERYCQQFTRSHYENFPVVTCCLPRLFRRHFYHLYAFCRWADDLSDEIDDPQRSLELLKWWRTELERCYANDARHPVLIALRNTIIECNIPQQPFLDLISAFEQDQQFTEYQSFEQLHDYCRRSANPVGRLVLYACGEFSEENAEWSDAICTGLQLTNFWQDIARDTEIGRNYLPQEDRQQHGYTPDDFHNRITNQPFLDLMQFQVQRAEQFLQAGLPLIGRLSGRIQIDIELFARGGLKLLEEIKRIGYRVWDVRPVLKKRHILPLLIGCVCRSFWRRIFGSKRIQSQSAIKE